MHFLIVLLIVLAIVSFIFLLVNFAIYQSKQRKVYCACAGSVHPQTSNSVSFCGFDWNKFKTNSGEALKKETHEAFLIKGHSMLLGGIMDGDIVFVKKKSKIVNMEFPSIIVLQRSKQNLVESAKEGDFAGYKTRRVWAKFDDIANCTADDVMFNILELPSFKEFKQENQEFFPELENLKDNFNKRLERFRIEYPKSKSVLISTTLDSELGPETDKIRFSIHSVDLLVGVVQCAFNIAGCAVDQVDTHTVA